MNTEQIKAILRGCSASLQVVLSDANYQKIQQHEYFSTNNDLMLGDAVQALNEVLAAIDDVEYLALTKLN
ncbi:MULTISPECIES: hypothetical protein [Nostoc]|jgi:hypothetical protein|uniref:DUF1659 domain-containing protein n=2 Tax=Nostoc TaxID=1177 RepID=A0ABR8IHW8_9NOSO|nr:MULTISPECIES: hypothetical protein [Nostoc]MBD2564515.1 hypothetical protein [Nostoc linckia FACHB-391]MBD2650070.1 hypothetical protein [Nostoc foliaceum FACHB-393]MBE8988063.1 hypothetical protein [Nostoc sp. LEGE 12450]MBW4429385.1 hypothetical protein [Nostoc desertorum CM1-VF14]